MLQDLINSSKFSQYDITEIKEIYGEQVLSILFEMANNGEIVFDNQRFYKIDQQRYIKGTIRVNKNGYGFVDTENQSFYIAKENMHTAMHNDLIIGKYIKYKNSDEITVFKIINRSITNFVGVVNNNKVKPDNQKIQNKIKIKNIAQFKLVNGHKVLCEILKYGEILEANITKIIGHKDEVGVDIESVLYEYQIQPYFSDEILQEVQHISDKIDIENRRDLRDLLTITIDGEDAKDLDDAISLIKEENNTRLFVHIADVSYFVGENSLVDLEARERGTSVYVVDRVVPMLPQYLSNGICSLHPNVDRATLTCEILFDKKGDIIEYEVYPSVINSNYRTSYTEINDLLNGKIALYEKYSEIYEMCLLSQILSDKISNRRKLAGSIDFDTKEAKILLNKQGKVKDIQLYKTNKVHKIIENFMISANECVAEILDYQSLPGVYRVHLSPDSKKMKEFVQFLKVIGVKHKINTSNVFPLQLQQLLTHVKKMASYPMISKTLLRSMQKAYYDANCLGHFGLALKHYSHFTSPIRRYPDLIVHRSLRKFLFELRYQEIQSFSSKLKDICDHASRQERNAIDAERAVEDLKKCEYMKSKVGMQFNGIISGVQNFGFFVELDNTVEGLVHIKQLHQPAFYNDKTKTIVAGKKIYQLGDKISIIVDKVDILNKTIDFKIKEKKMHEKNYRTKSKS